MFRINHILQVCVVLFGQGITLLTSFITYLYDIQVIESNK